MIAWLKKLMYDEYHVTIWYDSDPKAKTVYKLKKINKINNKQLVGVTVEGHSITMSVEVPFNYEMRKVL